MTERKTSKVSADMVSRNVGILHIGIGAFHRAHQAVYTDAAMTAQGGDWRIVGISLRSTDIVDALNAQNGEFALIERHPNGPRAQIVKSISHAIAASRDLDTVLTALSDPAIRIVTITVTEKAYGIDRQSGQVQTNHPAISADLANPENPTGLVGLLVEGLRRRRQGNIAPFTIVSCDNLPSNGTLLRAGVVDFAARIDDDLSSWIADHVAFPSTMVDRITPAATQKTRTDALHLTGRDGPVAIETEPFSQWVIEDHFPTGRPAWEAAGAIMVDDVEPYERMKLRMLNGSHSLIAYLGQLGGYRYVRDAMADAMFARLVKRHMENAAATMVPLSGIDFGQYAEDLTDRFRNPEIAHETRQIAMDGTEKLQQRIFVPAGELPDESPARATFALCLAAWMATMQTRVRNSGGEDVLSVLDDPRASEIRDVLQGRETADEIYDSLADLPGWMPEGLHQSARWRDDVILRLTLLLSGRVSDALAKDALP